MGWKLGLGLWDVSNESLNTCVLHCKYLKKSVGVETSNYCKSR